MKYIPKLLKGQSLYTIFDTIAPPKISSNLSSLASSRKSSNDDGKVTEKDLFKMLEDVDGLPNERLSLFELLQDVFTMSNLTGRDVKDISSIYLRSLFQLKTAVDNKKQYDEALKVAAANGSMNEPAISPNGKLIVQNEDGSLGTVSLKEYSENPEEYAGRIMTVSNIANLRAYDSDFANKNEVFNVIKNSMGFEAFLKLIDLAKISLSATTYTRTGQFAVEGKAVKGWEQLELLKNDPRLQQIAGSITLDGLYEYKLVDEDNLLQIKAFINYLVTTLPDNAKTWAAFKVGNPDKNKATLDLVFLYLMGSAKQSLTVDIAYKGTVDHVTGKSKSNNSDIKLNTAAKWLLGYGDSETTILNIGDSNFREVLTNTMPLVKMNGDYIGANSTLQDVSEGLYSTVLDLRNASMGMATINPAMFNLVIITDGKITSIDFPCIEKDGIIVPDLSKETSLKKRQADTEIIKRGIDLKNKKSIQQNYLTINLIYQQYGLTAAYNADGELNNQTWRRFGVINGATDGRVLGPSFNRSLVDPILDDYTADNIISIIKLNNKDYESTRNNFEWFGLVNADEIYKGTIWIPTKVNYLSALANQSMKPEEAMELEENQQTLEMQKKLQLGKQPKN